MTAELKLASIQIGTTLIFVANKFLIRPFVLGNDLPELAQIIVLSFPNLCEAVVGTLVVTYIGLVLNNRFLQRGVRLKDVCIYFVATMLAGVYVILQEFKVHNLGGINVYDPYDVLFSIVGLIIAFLLLLRIKPSIDLNQLQGTPT